MEEKELKKIKKTLEELLDSMGFECEVEMQENDDDSSLFNILVSSDSNILIGQYGANLNALQHLARLLVRRKIEEKARFAIDINSYRQQKSQSIISEAQTTAKQVIAEKKAVAMKPMTAYERRLVHMELSENDEVSTDSLGEGEERRIIIKPVSTI